MVGTQRRTRGSVVKESSSVSDDGTLVDAASNTSPSDDDLELQDESVESGELQSNVNVEQALTQNQASRSKKTLLTMRLLLSVLMLSKLSRSLASSNSLA